MDPLEFAWGLFQPLALVGAFTLYIIDVTRRSFR